MSSVCEDLANLGRDPEPRNGRPERRGSDGLRKNEVHRGSVASLRSGCRVPTRDEANGERRIGPFDGTSDLPAREPWHPEIGEDEIDGRPHLPQASETFSPVRGLNDLVTLSTEQVGHHLPVWGIIVDQEDSEGRYHRLGAGTRRIPRL